MTEPRPAVTSLTLSITGHTNAGKTALGRTLLQRDIGEVRDAPHVTTRAETYDWITTPDLVVRLADTPGFDSVPRLLTRMRKSGGPVGWFMREVWDRMTDPGFYHTQAALRQVMEDTDVVLHIVDTAAEPGGPGATTRAEIELLGFRGKPVIILLNQTGRAWTHAEAAVAESAWRSAFQRAPAVRAVMTLDAFTRCWPCELMLLDHVICLLPAARREAAGVARAALVKRHRDVFERAMNEIASFLHASATDAEPYAKSGVLGTARRAVAQLISGSGDRRDLEALHSRLNERLAARLAALVDSFVQAHGIGGRGERRKLAAAAEDFSASATGRLLWRDVAMAAAGGAAAGGAIDAAVGGASLGTGVAVGALLGSLTAVALGARGLAEEDGKVVWKDEALVRHLAIALRAYLAVAHFGRGQGSWRDHDGPAYWAAVIDGELNPRRAEAITAARAGVSELEHECRALGRAVLKRLYPDAPLG